MSTNDDGSIVSTSDQICISSPSWDEIIKIILTLIIAEIIMGLIFICVRWKRHQVDHRHGITHAEKNWLRRKLRRKGYSEVVDND
nr:uncharacterized protein CI109_001908 [Kwoniella shandongensis]KAA5529483.1 hypothetical protein CI109_001908 [Kwoniella shandongensis]